MKYCLLLLLLFGCIRAHAQKINGIVLDSSSRRPITFAVVSLNNTNHYCLTDSAGNFEIVTDSVKMFNDLNIYAMCYVPLTFKSRSSNGKQLLEIYLSPSAVEICETLINALKPVTIIKKMFEVIVASKRSNAERAFYRQFHEENGKAVRLIEADLRIYWIYSTERITVDQMRRSVNYESNGLQHGDHLFDLLSAEPLRYSAKTVLNQRNLHEYIFYLEKETNDNYIIRYTERNPSGNTIMSGKLTIEKESFHLLEFELERLKNPMVPVDIASGEANQYTWDKITETIKASYSWRGDSVFINSLEQTYFHNLINNVFKSVDYRVSESFSLFIYNNGKPIIPEKMELRSNLYGRTYPYDADFWKKYRPLKQHPLEKRFIRQLEKDCPLEGHFKAGMPFIKNCGTIP